MNTLTGQVFRRELDGTSLVAMRLVGSVSCGTAPDVTIDAYDGYVIEGRAATTTNRRVTIFSCSESLLPHPYIEEFVGCETKSKLFIHNFDSSSIETLYQMLSSRNKSEKFHLVCDLTRDITSIPVYFSPINTSSVQFNKVTKKFSLFRPPFHANNTALASNDVLDQLLSLCSPAAFSEKDFEMGSFSDSAEVIDTAALLSEHLIRSIKTQINLNETGNSTIENFNVSNLHTESQAEKNRLALSRYISTLMDTTSSSKSCSSATSVSANQNLFPLPPAVIQKLLPSLKIYENDQRSVSSPSQRILAHAYPELVTLSSPPAPVVHSLPLAEESVQKPTKQETTVKNNLHNAICVGETSLLSPKSPNMNFVKMAQKKNGVTLSVEAPFEDANFLAFVSSPCAQKLVNRPNIKQGKSDVDRFVVLNQSDARCSCSSSDLSFEKHFAENKPSLSDDEQQKQKSRCSGSSDSSSSSSSWKYSHSGPTPPSFSSIAHIDGDVTPVPPSHAVSPSHIHENDVPNFFQCMGSSSSSFLSSCSSDNSCSSSSSSSFINQSSLNPIPQPQIKINKHRLNQLRHTNTSILKVNHTRPAVIPPPIFHQQCASYSTHDSSPHSPAQCFRSIPEHLAKNKSVSFIQQLPTEPILGPGVRATPMELRVDISDTIVNVLNAVGEGRVAEKIKSSVQHQGGIWIGVAVKADDIHTLSTASKWTQ